MSEVITFTSGKGGVGKTTTTANVGVGLSLLEKSNFDRHGHRASQSRCCDGTRKPDRIQSGRCPDRKMQSEAGCHKRPQIPESFGHSICMCQRASTNHDRGDADAHGGVKRVV